MAIKHWLIGSAGLLAASFVTLPASAAPAGGIGTDLKSTASEMSSVDQVRRRCWWHRGHWHCRRHYRYYGYPSYYGYPGGYYGFSGPGFGFYFGGHRRHHHHRWHRHHRWR
jgi:hypothetical protein